MKPFGASALRSLALGGVSLASGLIAGSAWADHKVYSPIVHKGELEIEFRNHWTIDRNKERDGEGNHLFELGYGVTDWWLTAILAELEKEPQAGTRYQETAWENIFQLTPQGKYWLDAGLYLEYAHAARGGEADDVEGKLLLEKETGRFVHTANFIFEKQIGEHRENGTNFGYAARTRYRWLPQIEPAIEAYGEFGRISDFNRGLDQEHQIGPVLLGTFGRFSYELGWLFGVTRSTPNHTIKFNMEYEFFL